ncbi:MAG: hypothetical protein IPP29_15185 [Bacteroidetes bacterium]|nr:hypothetical protein [Bacteroidota bacterium]
MITHSTMLHCYELDDIHLQNNLDFTLNKNNTAAWLFCIDDFELMPSELLQLLSTEEKKKCCGTGNKKIDVDFYLLMLLNEFFAMRIQA